MGNYSHQISKQDNNKPFYAVMFVSRNKDNKELENFKERRNTFLSTKSLEELKEEFEFFLNKGQKGEFSRLYISVNARDNKKTQEALLKWLLDQTLQQNEVPMQAFPQKVASIASKKENRASSKWLFDYDDKEEKLDEFIKDLTEEWELSRQKDKKEEKLKIEKHKTPNGYAIIVSSGFDTRTLLEKWTEVELKKDELLCVYWAKKS